MTAVMGFAVAGTIAVSAQSAEMPNVTIVNDTIPTSLTGTPGDAVKGRASAINRKKGNCLACHVMPIPEQQFHRPTGPDLAGVGGHYDAATLAHAHC